MRRQQQGGNSLSQRSKLRNTTGATKLPDIHSPRGRSSAVVTPAIARRSKSLFEGHVDRRTARSKKNANSTNSLSAGKAPNLKRKNARADLQPPKGKEASKKVQTKIDFATGRVLFPVESGGKTQYFPLESEATPNERRFGSFVSDASVKKDATNSLIEGGDSVNDVINQRQLFASTTANGKKEYLPSESDANALELASGKYIPDAQLESPSIAQGLLDTDINKKKQKLRYDFTKQRNLFAVRSKDGKDIYLPQKSKATTVELKRGLYVDDSEVSKKIDLGPATAMTKDKPRYDISKGRKVYGVKDKDGKTKYLPRASDASDFERARGLFIDDAVVDTHEKQRLRTALADKSADYMLRRAQRANKLAAGTTSKNIDNSRETISYAKDGTPIWDGFTPPEVSYEKQRETLKKLHSTYDIAKKRMLYPAEIAKGKIKYLPLLEDASNIERIRGLYVSFVPPEPLENFLKDNVQRGDIAPRNFTTQAGELKAYALNDIEQAFENAPSLILRSAKYVSNVARESSVLQQQRVNG